MSDIDGQLSTFRSGISGFLGHEDPTGVAAPLTPSSSAVVMDNSSTSFKFPHAPQTEGVWYGTGSRAATAAVNGDAVVLGNNSSVSTAKSIIVGNNSTETLGLGMVVGSSSSIANGGIVIGSNTSGDGSIILGNNIATVNQGHVIVGQGFTNAQGNILGSFQVATSTACCIIGGACAARKAGDICIGTGAQTSATPGTASVSIMSNTPLVAAAAGASDLYMLIRINNVEYKLLLHT